MTDKELLELAARAAGIEGQYLGGDIVCQKGKDITIWNPLQSDGDALRLVVKLNIRVYADDLGYDKDGIATASWADTDITWQVPYNGDKYAAARKAIVLVAAEIGKATK